MALNTALRRAFLRCLYIEATKASLALSDALQTALERQFASVRSGRIVIGSTAANRSVTFALPVGLNPQDVTEAISELIDLYDDASSALVSSGVASPTDAQIYTEMLARLKPITETTADWSGMRIGVGTPVTITA